MVFDDNFLSYPTSVILILLMPHLDSHFKYCIKATSGLDQIFINWLKDKYFSFIFQKIEFTEI